MTAHRARIAAYWAMLVAAVLVFVVGDLYARAGVDLACIPRSGLFFCANNTPPSGRWALIVILGLIGWGLSRGGDRWLRIAARAVQRVVERARRIRRGPHDDRAMASAERPSRRDP